MPLDYEESKRKRANNREGSAAILSARGIKFDSPKADGSHLIIHLEDMYIIDFWPGTGLWHVRGRKEAIKGRGVFPLLLHIKKIAPWATLSSK